MNVNQESEQTQVDVGPRLGRERISWNHVLLVAAVMAALAVFAGMYYSHNFTGSIDRNASDIAQVARNISEGKGFSTRLIRPFNLTFKKMEDIGMPELNHAPLHPYAMAGMFSLRGASDQAAVWTSMLFLLITLFMTYLLGSLLFDWRVGLLSATVMGVSAPVLQAGISGQEWPMAALWFTVLLYVLALHHGAGMQQRGRTQLIYGGLTALPVALLYYTNHVFFFIALPVLIYVAFAGTRRLGQSVMFIVVLALAVSPIVYRNWIHTGSAILGANTWDIMAHSDAYPGDTLYRSADPENRELGRALLFPAQHFNAFSEKLVAGSGEILSVTTGMLGWVVLPFAVVCILYKFRKPTANCIRGFIYGAGPVLVASFALYSVGTEAILVLIPPAAIFASAYFLLLLEAKKLHPEYTKGVVVGLLLITALPAISSIFWRNEVKSRQAISVADQFYGERAERMGSNTAIFTDVPWVAAWRTKSVGVWLPLTDDDVYRLMDRGIPMSVIILTPESATYSPNEAWHVLHRIRIWRRYVENPEQGLKDILNQVKAIEEEIEDPESFFKRVKRGFTVSETIAGYRTTINPLAPDDIQVFLPPDVE